MIARTDQATGNLSPRSRCRGGSIWRASMMRHWPTGSPLFSFRVAVMATLPRLQFSMRTLIVSVLLVAICLATNRAYLRWYVHKYPSHYVFSVLHDQIHDGDTFEHVAQYFESAEKTD